LEPADFGAVEDLAVEPPARARHAVEAEDRFDFESGGSHFLPQQVFGVAEVMSERFVERAVDALAFGDEDDRPAILLQRGVDIAQRAEIVLDVFDDV